jgi:hypothetical protein
VDLVQIDVICLETTEACVDRVHDMSAGGTHVVASGAHAVIDLGRENDILARDVEILQGLAEYLFAFAGRIDIGRVKEVNTGVDRGLDVRRLLLVHASDRLIDAYALPKCHRAKAKTRTRVGITRVYTAYFSFLKNGSTVWFCRLTRRVGRLAQHTTRRILDISNDQKPLRRGRLWIAACENFSGPIMNNTSPSRLFSGPRGLQLTDGS